VERGRLWFLGLGGAMAFAFAFVAAQHRSMVWVAALFLAILLIFSFLGKFLNRVPFFSKRVAVPADLLIMRLAEVFQSIPRLLLIVAIAGLAPAKDQSVWLMIALIGAFSWTSVARFVRAELLRVRALDFVTAARGLGLSEWRVLGRHALPNALRPVLIVLALGMANAVLLEATLSFFGYGREIFKGASWGSLLASDQSGGNQLAYWWVALPPGLAICLTLLALNALGEAAADGPQNQNG
jgi:peptide/nickel transport system permease protein